MATNRLTALQERSDEQVTIVVDTYGTLQETYTMEEAATAFRTKARNVRNWAKAGKIATTVLANGRRVIPQEVMLTCAFASLTHAEQVDAIAFRAAVDAEQVDAEQVDALAADLAIG